MSHHLRGRVRPNHSLLYRANGRQRAQIVYSIEVVNTITGRVVHRDNGCGLAASCDAARKNVARCIDMWRMGIRSSDLKQSKRDLYLLPKDAR